MEWPNRTLGFLRRNLRVSSKSIKECAYKALVRPQLEYACQVWDPHKKCQIDDLERIQKKAAHWVTNRKELVNDLGWPLLSERRRAFRINTMTKYHLGEIHIDTPQAPVHRNLSHNTRHSH